LVGDLEASVGSIWLQPRMAVTQRCPRRLRHNSSPELKKFLAGPGHAVPVSFARYTGQEKPEERERIKNNPPDIFLTNFMMLELLMTRQSELDKAVIANCCGLKFIVLDELHTYRGRR
jgi:ATP-dependent helicase YprA (DUF1998 family)